jgi:hypothetical protein
MAEMEVLMALGDRVEVVLAVGDQVERFSVEAPERGPRIEVNPAPRKLVVRELTRGGRPVTAAAVLAVVDERKP